MNAQQLQALAAYRKHKHCCCDDCRDARAILKDMDEQGRRWPQQKKGVNG